jgi:hypothetical protein
MVHMLSTIWHLLLFVDVAVSNSHPEGEKAAKEVTQASCGPRDRNCGYIRRPWKEEQTLCVYHPRNKGST